MKKLLLLLALLLTAALCAVSCTGGEVPNDTTDGNTETQTDAPTEGSETTAAPTEEVTEPDTDPDTQPGDTEPEEIVIPDVYPTPLEITAGDTYVDLSKACLHRYVLLYADELEGKGITFEENGVNIFAEIRDLTEFSYGADEGYILTVNAKGVKIEAQTERGLHYAVMTLLQLTEDGKCPAVTVKDAPRNPIRGVIEGFYGTAWTHEYRKDLFRFMGENKMNAYIYAPKDDPKHRAQWRSLYTEAELERMTDLITTANENHVKFIYAISPGGDINLAGGYEADFKKLMAKCEQVYELGCRDFAIFLDDIPTLDAEGHAKLLSDFQTRFVETHEGVSDLIAITTEYGDPFLTDYTDRIAPLIHKDVVLMWTGPGVIPESITNQSLWHIIKTYGRKVLIWWNYPVNDTLANHLFMGPCVGLEKTLYQSITGLTANPMNQGYASMVPLFTTGDYLWNPEAYDSEKSLIAACEALMPDASEALLDFISMTCASGINKNTDSVELKKLLDSFKKEASAETVQALSAYFRKMVENADAILASSNTEMVEEIRQWVEKYRAYGEMGLIYAEMEADHLEGKALSSMVEKLGRFKAIEKSIRQNPRLVSENVLTSYFSTLNSRFSILLGQIDGISFAPATPYTNCNPYEDYVPDYMTDGDDSTYFWTHGDLNTAAGNKTGYLGVDLGEIIDVKNVYIATGAGGSDAMAAGIVEYSADGKEWTVIHNGNCGNELYLQGLSIKARYIRIRAAANAGSGWVKCRAFEVNTNRAASDEGPAGAPTLTTSLPTYSTYFPEFMSDSDPNTYFWSSRGGQKGDYLEIDLGAVIAVSRITFRTGVPAHAADYVQSGELCWSADGQSWTTICAIKERDTVKDVNIRARYIRVNITADQTSWITVSEFTAVSEDTVSPLLRLDSDFVPRTDLLTLTDGHYVTYFAPDKAEGHNLSVTANESGKVTLIALALPENGLTVTVKDASGKEIKTVDLTYITEIEAPTGSVIEIPLGNGLMLAEVIW